MAFIPQWCSVQFWACTCSRSSSHFRSITSQRAVIYTGTLIIFSFGDLMEMFSALECFMHCKCEREEAAPDCSSPNSPDPTSPFSLFIQNVLFSLPLSKVLTKSIGLTGERNRNQNSRNLQFIRFLIKHDEHILNTTKAWGWAASNRNRLSHPSTLG